MNRTLLFITALLVLSTGAGCSTTATSGLYHTIASDSDFTPPIGRPANPPKQSAGERRLLTATSTDGVHFTPTGKILTDQGNVPDIVVDRDGTIRAYYIGQSIEEGKESTVVAISRDNGETWQFNLLSFHDFPMRLDPSDPDVVLLEDGTYRMYYTSSIDRSTLGIVYAESPDGIAFTYKGVALESSGNVVDSSTFFFDGQWHMHVLQEKGEGQLHATSKDGRTFTLAETPNLRFPLDRYIASNELIEEDTVRLFAFNFSDIRSFTSSDAVTWVADDITLEGDAEATLGTNYIQDSSVAKLNDGSYLLIYVSELPETE